MSADLDVAALARWLDTEGIGDGPVSDVREVVGGTQNDLFAFTRNGQRLVLRRQARREGSVSTSKARREARVLAALGRTAVPHPRLVAACDDPEALGSPCQVNEFVDGFTLWADPAELDPAARSLIDDPAALRRIGEQVVDGLACLARLDPATLGLTDLGRGAGWVARQPTRWHNLLTQYQDEGGEAIRLDGADAVVEWLRGHAPPDDAPGLVHGDAHLGNVLVHRDGSGVSIVDWELATVGDPLLDLAQLLVTWPTSGGPYAWRVRASGLPQETEVVARWEQGSGRSAARLPWFRVLAGYRLAVLLEGTHVRSLQGSAPAAVGAALHDRANQLMRTARDTAAATERKRT